MTSPDPRRVIVSGWISLGLALLSACSGGGPAGESASAGAARPHVVLLIVDTLRADALGAYGSTVGVSPELDRVATEGLRFADVVAPCSWTRPSIGSMLTGRYPRSLGIYRERRGILADRFTTLAEAVGEAGYATFGITANPHLNTSYNFHQGFDDYVDSTAVYSFMEISDDQRRYKAGQVASALDMFGQVVEWLDRQEEGVPVFVQVDMMEVHEWYRGSRSLTRPDYDSLELELPSSGYRRGQAHDHGAHVHADAYYMALRQASADIGDFIEFLQARPGWEDALFIVVSDHGEGIEDHPSVADSEYHGLLLYESQLDVPWVMYRTGWEYAGRVVERRVRLLDFMPTVLDALGIAPPPGLDGISLMPLARDPGARVDLPEYFVAETELRQSSKIAVYGPEWKYIVSMREHEGTSPRELQRIGRTEDGSRTNRIKAEAEVAKKLADFLDAWRTRHTKAEIAPHKQEVSEQELEQLRALGYLE